LPTNPFARECSLSSVQYPREDPAHIPGLRDGVPILGMEKFVREDSQLRSIFESGAAD
jgi:hypothetical protein